MTQKTARLGDVAADSAAPSQASAPPAIEPIWSVVDSLSQTLECIKNMYATTPSGPTRERLEAERTNLVLGLFMARVAAIRVSSADNAESEGR